MKIYGDQTTELMLRIRQRMAAPGWDHGAPSIWFGGMDTGKSGE